MLTRMHEKPDRSLQPSVAGDTVRFIFTGAAYKNMPGLSRSITMKHTLYNSIDEMLHNSHQCGFPQIARWGMIAGTLMMTPVIWVSISR